MRKAILLSSLALGLTFTAFAQEKPADPRAAEPPLEFVLEIDGQKIDMSANAPAKVTIAGKPLDARIAVRPDRLFAKAGISFRYPSQHAFEADTETEGMTQWTLDGNDNVIIVHHLDEKVDAADLVKETADGLVEQFGGKNVTRSKGELSLGGKKYPSTVLTVKIADERLHYDIVSIAAEKATCLLMVQDTLEEDGSQSAETAVVLQLLDKTFKLGK